ncbi:hypothetical protein TRIUR3_06375 [Triticum urartu]|uniref:Uncharacterized protein n=1 Tax=Triticum urartu TaxID=4572 RepID=M8ANF4_TRIUA|nr:hypothetical protein TRIUR3_06375 [Triticum urartu]
MATSKEDIKHGTAQARLTVDDELRTGYFNGSPLEGGKIADSDPVDLFAQARHVADASPHQQQQQPRSAPYEAFDRLRLHQA